MTKLASFYERVSSLRPGRHLACLLKGIHRACILAAVVRQSQIFGIVAPHSRSGWIPERGGNETIMIFGFQSRWSILLPIQIKVTQSPTRSFPWLSPTGATRVFGDLTRFDERRSRNKTEFCTFQRTRKTMGGAHKKKAACVATSGPNLGRKRPRRATIAGWEGSLPHTPS
jgi:hypothetical protein